MVSSLSGLYLPSILSSSVICLLHNCLHLIRGAVNDYSVARSRRPCNYGLPILLVLLSLIAQQRADLNKRTACLKSFTTILILSIPPLPRRLHHLHHEPLLLSVCQHCLAALVDSLADFKSNMILLFDLRDVILHLLYQSSRE